MWVRVCCVTKSWDSTKVGMGKTPRRCFPPSRLSAGGDARGCTLCSARQWSSISTASVLHELTFGVDGRGWHPPDTWDLCSAHPHGTGVRSLRPLVTCRKKKKKETGLYLYAKHSFSREESTQHKAVFPLETQTELTKTKTNICQERQIAYPLLIFKQLAAFSKLTHHQKSEHWFS